MDKVEVIIADAGTSDGMMNMNSNILSRILRNINIRNTVFFHNQALIYFNILFSSSGSLI